MTPKTTLLIQPKWIITGDSNTPPLTNHSLLMHADRIHAILPNNEIPETSTKIALPQHALLPGFINTHTHLAMNYFRGLADDLALMDWLTKHIWPAEKKWLSHEFVRDASLLAMAEMIRGGTTCFNDMYFFLHATAEAADIAGLRGSIGMTIIDFPTAFAKTPAEYFAKGLEFLAQYKNHPRIRTTLAPHAPYTVSDENLLKVKNLAEQHALKINMHVHETADEIKQSLEKYQLRPLARLHKLGLVSPELIAIHMTQLNADDLTLLKAQQPHIVHCPESNMKLASGICPIGTLSELNINIALGTDGAASNNDLDMLGEMQSAALLAKLTTRDPTTLPANAAIQMATLNGAKALGIDSFTGSLQPGKSADIIAVKLDEIETLPHFHPDSSIVYAATRNQVTDVWVAGKQLLKNRELLTLDETELKEKIGYWQKKFF